MVSFDWIEGCRENQWSRTLALSVWGFPATARWQGFWPNIRRVISQWTQNLNRLLGGSGAVENRASVEGSPSLGACLEGQRLTLPVTPLLPAGREIRSFALSRPPHHGILHRFRPQPIVSQPWARASETRSSNKSFFLKAVSLKPLPQCHTHAHKAHTPIYLSLTTCGVYYAWFITPSRRQVIKTQSPIPPTSNPHFCLRDRWPWRKPPSSSPGALSRIPEEWMNHR